ncbi:hypothetical protein [Paraburkholderia solisilvae]|uniref:Neurotransmitter-gated ion-channel ligand-binding domain-containing protein n=1 Tax=Paraburkholderia solisilvae TaxID=624376 RepID=A0A6J5DUP0_9BURK|nr:hypothetical protein [Paraburkholderia solisilvae]CAB3756615.1 hypothetical protein LMG29739_02492 [Paraburkholderia solisilvae]
MNPTRQCCLFTKWLYYCGAYCALALLGLLLLPGVASSQVPKAPPERYKIGMYVTSIYAVDTADGTFAADLWIWSVGRSATKNPLQTMEFVDSDTITRRLDSTTKRKDAHGDLYWRQMKVIGKFRQEWDLRQFPFDEQVLHLTVEEGVDDNSTMLYEADVNNTGYLPGASPQGWRITGQRVDVSTSRYTTKFGDPAGGNSSDYTKLQMTITLQRASLATFLNLAAPLYAAFLLCTVSFLLHKDGRPLIESRMTLLAGALFAVVLNFRAVSNVLGNEHHLTIVDRLNIAVLVDIVFATIITIAATITTNKGKAFSLHLEYICGALVALSFIAFNLFLIISAV